MLYARKLDQINFQISQNAKNWYDFTYFAISVILADLEINLDEFSGV